MDILVVMVRISPDIYYSGAVQLKYMMTSWIQTH